MVITPQPHADRYQLKLEGRLDANWAGLVDRALETAIRAGQHHIELDFGGVSYISSAGIRVLLKYSKQLKAVHGSVRVVRPTEAVFSVIRLSGLAGVLLTTAPDVMVPDMAAASPSDESTELRRWNRNGVDFEAYELSAAGLLDGHVLGRPEAFAHGRLSPEDGRVLRCADDLLAIGLGAFGSRPDDIQTRLGESLAIAGSAITLPTDGSSVPDFQLTEGELVPELHLQYGLMARGSFSHLFRFEANHGPRGVLGLDGLVESALQELDSGCAGFAILAESASVVGAMLKRSPALADGQSPLAFPGVRDWLSFTTERTDEKNLLLIVGIAERAPRPETASCLRPLGAGTNAQGHFHAAIFPYRPLPKGRLELSGTVSSVLGTGSAQAVMHLLADEREFEGLGQTDLMRGACWAGRLRLGGPGISMDTTL